MTQIVQTAGACKIETWTEATPMWFDVKVDGARARVSVETIYDLHYCLERVLAQLPAAPGGRP